MKYFGTDGIRGVANKELTPDLAYRAGFAAASVLTKNLSHRCKIFIGRDTRISGNMLECALAAGICAAGADVYFLGVPAHSCRGISYGKAQGRRRRGDFGVSQPL